MVPNEWEILSLSQVSKVIDCKHRTPHYVESGIPLISPGTIKWGALDLTSPTKRVTEDEYQSLMDHCTVEIGDLVMSRNQSVGVLSFVDSMKPFVLGQDTVLIKAEKSDSKYLFYKIQSEEVQKRIVRLAGGSTFARINLADIRKLILECPPLVEQKKIAQILSTWDQAISATEKLLENSQQQKKALMQQLLTGKKRLLDENGVKFSEEWKKGKLNDLVKIDSGFAFKSSDFTNSFDGVPIIRMSDFKNGGLDIREAAKVSKEITNSLQRFRLNSGDFVFGMSGSLSNYGWVKEKDLPCYLNQRVGRLVANEQGDQKFVTYLYLSEKVQQSIIDKAAGAAQLNISVNDLRGIQVFYPVKEEQQKIAKIISVADKEIEILQKKLDCLKQEKKALMQQLLTGKKRVKVAA
ncbi:restriction endonuclease subunit S [Acinetobacter thermotolerans]|uniref:restriction endonuclease subunit S n=1 Tax=Acinetobacter thermotolerans TaxID=3151487 RepID=UPI00325A9ABE